MEYYEEYPGSANNVGNIKKMEFNFFQQFMDQTLRDNNMQMLAPEL